ncbi:MAG TPA: DinB family protein [Bryobacteraceae bacterium]|jgi:hypothetical protein|nr:DinB family protein [Bryobacteraceae bacterium]
MGIVAQISSNERLTSEEILHARKYLEQTRSGMIGATAGLSEAQWRFKPSGGGWSIAEILDVIIMQERVSGPL